MKSDAKIAIEIARIGSATVGLVCVRIEWLNSTYFQGSVGVPELD
jgi:hypothetical protein